MEFIPNEEGFVIKTDILTQTYSWSVYDTGEIIYPKEFISIGKPSKQISLREYAQHYIDTKILLTNHWWSTEGKTIFYFLDDRWEIGHKLYKSTLWHLEFLNPSEELKLKIMNMILQGCDIWYKEN